MPQTRQAKKALKQSRKKEQVNHILRETLRTALKKTKRSVEAKATDAEELIKSTIVKIDKAAKKGLLKKNTAARRKSKLVLAFNKTKKA